MKKILFVLLMLPGVVFGDVCEFNKDNSTSDNRNLVCDVEKRTTTNFKSDDVVVLENSVCKITCTEEIVFSIDPMKKVLAGTSFNYPLYVSGERKCKADYNYNDYETKIKRLVSEYESLTGTEKETKSNEIVNYYSEKKECDKFTEKDSEYEKKYAYEGYDVNLKVETSTNEVTVPYVFKELDEYSSDVRIDETNYNSCNFNEASNKCIGSKKTIAGWTETARIFGKYTMNDVYLEKYTGVVKNVGDEDTCNVGDRFFVDYNELTRPIKNDPTDKGYKLTLIANDLGNNLKGQKEWNLNVDCWYQVKNLLFPQAGRDDNYEEYGTTAFQYRVIDTSNPFPKYENKEGTLPANWEGKIDIAKADISNLQRFVIMLDRSSIKKIREYNEEQEKSGKYYGSFDIEIKEKDGKEMEYSSFIEANPNIIDRK